MTADIQWIAGLHPATRAVLEDSNSASYASLGRLLWSIEQNIEAMSICYRADEPLVISVATLGRSVLEATITALRLFDPALSPRERVIRGFAHMLGSLEVSIGSPNAAGLEASTPGAHPAVKSERKRAVAAGITLNKAAKGWKIESVEFEGVVANIKVNVTDEAKRYFGDAPGIWQLGSGAAHSTEWYLAGATPRLSPSEAVAVPVLQSNSALSVLRVAEELIKTLSEYTGTDNSDLLKKVALRFRGTVMRLDRLKQSVHVEPATISSAVV